ncbi:hypothetical protein AB0B09_39195, partial [Streptomyces sp. NPDC044948]
GLPGGGVYEDGRARGAGGAVQRQGDQAAEPEAVLLGGDIGGSPADQSAAYERWRKALRLPGVQGMVVGRSLLYPAEGSVEQAVDTAVGLL